MTGAADGATPRFDFGSSAQRRLLAVGDVLCAEGDRDTDVFQVVDGELDVVRTTDEGPMVVAQLGPGRLAGEVSNIMGGGRTASLIASTPCTVNVFTRDEYFNWLDDHPDAAMEIAAQARHRLNRTRAAGVLVRLFGLDNQQVVDAIVDEIDWITLSPGEVLFEQGDDADAAYLLIAGRLQIVAFDADGTRSLDIEIGRGEIVGEMGIIEEQPRNAGARAIRETTLARISRSSFEQLTSTYPTLLLRVFHTIIDRLMRRHKPDVRARVVGLALTTDTLLDGLPMPFVDAVGQHGSALHLSLATLGRYVRDVDGPGSDARISEFLHEADVAHDYVVLESHCVEGQAVSRWPRSVATQADRFVLLCSASPDIAERARIREQLDLLTETQRAAAWIARVHPPGVLRPRHSARLLHEHRVGEVHNLRSDVPGDFARLGRLATGNGVGVVLGGGGAKGIAHIGALRALFDRGITPDRIGGASMGSIIAAFCAQGNDHDQMLQASIEEFRTNLLDYTVPLVSLVKAERMTDGIRKRFDGWDITDLWVPFFAVSTNLTRSELAVHRSGDLVTAVRASVAIPVVLPPVPIDGDLHVDGGVLDNVPSGTMALDPSIGTVVAIDVSPPGGPAADEDFGLSVSGFDALRARWRGRRTSTSQALPDIGQTLMSSMLIGSTKARNEADARSEVDLYLDLDLAGIGLLKFEHHEHIVQRGYEGAAPAIEEWLAVD